MTYYQRKYCEDCEKYYYYNDVDGANPNEPCPENGEHTTRDCVIVCISQF